MIQSTADTRYSGHNWFTRTHGNRNKSPECLSAYDGSSAFPGGVCVLRLGHAAGVACCAGSPGSRSGRRCRSSGPVPLHTTPVQPLHRPGLVWPTGIGIEMDS